MLKIIDIKGDYLVDETIDEYYVGELTDGVSSVFNGVIFQANNYILLDTEFLTDQDGKDELLILHFSTSGPWEITF